MLLIDDEKTALQKRVRQLESELMQLRGDMRNELDRATREKEDALSRAQSQKVLFVLYRGKQRERVEGEFN